MLSIANEIERPHSACRPNDPWDLVLSTFDRAVGGTIPRHRWAQLTATVAELSAAANASSLLDVLAAGLRG
jgi:hypothetical protein